MTDPVAERVESHPTLEPVIAVGPRTADVDACIRALANRRIRFALYHLREAGRPVRVRDLAAAVEASVAPRGATLAACTLEDAIDRFTHVELATLQSMGIVSVGDGWVALDTDPLVPVERWLETTAEEELGHVQPTLGR